MRNITLIVTPSSVKKLFSFCTLSWLRARRTASKRGISESVLGRASRGLCSRPRLRRGFVAVLRLIRRAAPAENYIPPAGRHEYNYGGYAAVVTGPLSARTSRADHPSAPIRRAARPRDARARRCPPRASP